MFTPFAFVKSAATAPAPPVINLLLDDYPNAAFAHSVRKLRTAYSGPCMQIRRTNDLQSTDIGFDSNGFVDTAAILTFLQGSNGRVTIWYDQSGNGVNFTPKGAGSAEDGFKVTNESGTLYTLNGKFSLYTPNGYQFNMGSDAYAYNGTEYQILTVTATAPFDPTPIGGSNNNYGRIFSYKNSSRTEDYDNCNAFISFYGYGFSGRVGTGQNGNFANSAATAFSSNTQYIGWNYKQQNTVGNSLNGGTEATTTTGCSTTGLDINRVRYGTDYKNADSSLIGWIQEMVTWETYTSGNKSGILSNVNSFYGTY